RRLIKAPDHTPARVRIDDSPSTHGRRGDPKSLHSTYTLDRPRQNRLRPRVLRTTTGAAAGGDPAGFRPGRRSDHRSDHGVGGAVLISVDHREVGLAVLVQVHLEPVRLTVTGGVRHPDVGLAVAVRVRGGKVYALRRLAHLDSRPVPYRIRRTGSRGTGVRCTGFRSAHTVPVAARAGCPATGRRPRRRSRPATAFSPAPP